MGSNLIMSPEGQLVTMQYYNQIKACENTTLCWSIYNQKGAKGHTITLRKIEHENLYSSCYEVRCINYAGRKNCPDPSDPKAIIRFCYPAVIVTGVPKCGTSAMYDLLTRIPGAVVMHEKVSLNPIEACDVGLWLPHRALPREC